MDEISKAATLLNMFDELKQTTSRLDKEDILVEYCLRFYFIKPVLKFIFNDFIITGVSSKKFAQVKLQAGGYFNRPSLEEIMDYLKTHNTGTTDDLRYLSNAYYWYQAYRDIVEILATKELSIGITATTLNKLFGPNFIPKFLPMLGKEIGTVKNLKFPYIATEKYDGVRRLCIYDKEPLFVSRSGKLDGGLVEIMTEAKTLPKGYVYDGELLAEGDFENNLELRQATVSKANSKGQKVGLIFVIFDMIPYEEFFNNIGEPLAALERKTLLAHVFNDTDSLSILNPKRPSLRLYANYKYLKAAPVLGLVYTQESIENISATVIKKGGEGIMLNQSDAYYEHKRTDNLLKVKSLFREILVIHDIEKGKGKYKNTAGKIVCKYKGNLVKIGSGLTDDLRKDLLDNQYRHIGREILVSHFGESKNIAGTISLNCPIFKGFIKEDL